MNKNLLPEFDQYAARYEADLNQSIPSAFAEDAYFAEYKIRYISGRIGSNHPTSLLDFGCGIGRSLSLLNRQFPSTELWGYDVSSQSVELASQQYPEMAHLTSNLDDLPNAGFDIIFTANVFHHIPLTERTDALIQCKRLLKDGGRIFLFEHNPFNPVTRLIFERCPFDKDAVMLKRSETLKLAEKAGLKVVRSDYTLFFPRQLSFLRPTEQLLGWLPLGAQYCVEMAK
jgi:ubiquinone/menaquinone biosynthesis C-methylase UbiE